MICYQWGKDVVIRVKDTKTLRFGRYDSDTTTIREQQSPYRISSKSDDLLLPKATSVFVREDARHNASTMTGNSHCNAPSLLLIVVAPYCCSVINTNSYIVININSYIPIG